MSSSELPDAPAQSSLSADTPVNLRCSVLAVRGDEVLLIHRHATGDWVLPGGRPRSAETTASCARREVSEETGLDVEPQRCALVLEVIDPVTGDRTVDLVFLGAPVGGGYLVGEAGTTQAWVPIGQVRELNLRPPIGGYLPGIVSGSRGTAAYLGNMWRPERQRSVRADAGGHG